VRPPYGNVITTTIQVIVNLAMGDTDVGVELAIASAIDTDVGVAGYPAK